MSILILDIEKPTQHAKGKLLFGIGSTLIICAAILISDNNIYPTIGSGIAGITFWLLSWRVHSK